VHSAFVCFAQAALSIPWKLSTSQLPQRQTTLKAGEGGTKVFGSPSGGFGPVNDDGYGVSYMIGTVCRACDGVAVCRPIICRVCALVLVQWTTIKRTFTCRRNAPLARRLPSGLWIICTKLSWTCGGCGMVWSYARRVVRSKGDNGCDCEPRKWESTQTQHTLGMSMRSHAATPLNKKNGTDLRTKA
jgi:Choline/Carnitine o-acyltransferase